MPILKNGISQKMKNFCHKYLECGDATEAYFTAYDTKNRAVAAREGSLLLQRDDIREYIAQINKPIVNKIHNEREKKRRIIWNRIERSIEKEDETAIARYMDILNKMDAEYVNINRNIDDSGERLANLDTDQLKKLLETTETEGE